MLNSKQIWPVKSVVENKLDVLLLLLYTFEATLYS